MAHQILFEAWFELFKTLGGVQYVIGDTHTLDVFIAVNHRKIHQFIQKYEEGYEQVVAKIVSRNQVPFVRRQMSNLFYLIANRATQNLIPRGVSDFRLLSRPVYLATRQMQERNRFLRGLIAWTGFKTAVIEIERQDRFAGDSKFVSIPIKKVIKWATSAILSHTSAPLTALSISGFLLSALSFFGTVIAAILWFTGGVPFSGFGTLFALITLSFSLTMLALGVIAQYIALIYEEVKGRPVYIVAERTDEEKPF
jgi:dolichol-phosphate mannosyltransferase